MFSRTSARASGLPTWAASVLTLCLLALSAHFVGEGLAPAVTASPLLAAAPGPNSHPGHDLTEDHFVVSPPLALTVERSRVWASPARPFEVNLLRLAPPVPPPNR